MTECTCGHLAAHHVGLTEFDINPCFMEGCDCDDFEAAVTA